MMKMFEKKAKLAGILVIVLAAAAAAFAQRAELSGARWQLTHINGQAVSRNKAFLEFDTGNDRFSGNAGCNSMFGSVAVNGRRIDFGPVGTTRMACSDREATRTESRFITALGRVNRFRRTGANLELLEQGAVLLRFKSVRGDEENEESLESKKWLLEDLGGRPIRTGGGTPFVAFDAGKSSAGGDTGCNLFGGSYAVSGNTIRIYDTISTMRACIEDERMGIERRFMDALQNTNRFEIRGGDLFLFRNEKLLVKFRGENK
jgi:heat shock protein HslJ